jgi:hypothetical protein
MLVDAGWMANFEFFSHSSIEPWGRVGELRYPLRKVLLAKYPKPTLFDRRSESDFIETHRSPLVKADYAATADTLPQRSYTAQLRGSEHK